MAVFKTSIVGVIIVILIWRILTLGFAEHYSRYDDNDDIAKALSWDSAFPPALFKQSRWVEKQDPAKAEALLIKSIEGDPTNALAYAKLAEWVEARKRGGEAETLMNRASDLAPLQIPVQLAAGAFWMRQGRLDAALAHWDVVLARRSSLRSQLYPVLLALVSTPQAAAPFAHLLQDNIPSWWTSFFVYAVRSAPSLDEVRLLYRWRRVNQQPISREERRTVIERLEKEGQWLEAYFVWLNNLDKQQSGALGNLYNGSFELPLSNEDFDWRTPGVRGVQVGTAVTAGAEGEKAVRLEFQDTPVRFQHLYQHLALSSGHYQLQGFLKLDSLQAKQGLQWQLKCLQAKSGILLGNSERFMGSTSWQPFSFDFEVPATECPAQELKLVLVGRFPDDFKVKGTAWFDAMSIRRVKLKSPRYP